MKYEKKKYIIEGGFDLNDYGYTDVNSYSVMYKYDESSVYYPGKWYVGIDVAEDPESVKIQKQRDKKIDTILS